MSTPSDMFVLSVADFLITIDFQYENRRDPFSIYRSAFLISTTRRCRTIEVHTRADRSRLVRRYEFIYPDQLMPLGTTKISA